MARRQGRSARLIALNRIQEGKSEMSHPAWIITPAELKEILSTPEKKAAITLLDVREQEEYDESRIEGCKLIPLGEIQMRAPKELDKQADIVVYCAHGVRSMNALMAMRMLGFEKLRSLDGGIAAWEELSSAGS
jgi:rhodanese-related sulfurtransferase